MPLRRFFLLPFLVLLATTGRLLGEEKISVETADRLMESGRAAEAADHYYAVYLAKPTGRQAAEALIKTGRALDLARLKFYEDADRQCYLGKRRDEARPECFEAYIAKLNKRFGEGSFSYHGDQVQFTYNATHFRKVLDEFPGGHYEDEASLMMLRGDTLLGNEPDGVCRKVEGWIQTWRNSRLLPKALLLLGRLRADAFVTLKSGGFVLIDGKVDTEGISLERSRQQAKGLAAFKEVLDKYPKSPEAAAARREHEILKAGKDDGIFYGISY